MTPDLFAQPATAAPADPYAIPAGWRHVQKAEFYARIWPAIANQVEEVRSNIEAFRKKGERPLRVVFGTIERIGEGKDAQRIDHPWVIAIAGNGREDYWVRPDIFERSAKTA